MTIRRYEVTSKVEYTVVEYEKIVQEFELDDEDEPFTETELENILGQLIHDDFKRNSDYDDFEIIELDWHEV